MQKLLSLKHLVLEWTPEVSLGTMVNVPDTGRLNYLKDSVSKTETETGWVFHPWVCRYQNGQEVKNPPRESSQSSQNSHQETAKIAKWWN